MANLIERPQADTQPRPIAGIRLATGASGTRYKNRTDLTLLEVAPGATVECLFTRNKFCAAPVTVAREHWAQGQNRYLIINAGNANAGTGTPGEERCLEVCAAVAKAAGCATADVLPFSTGVIGQQLNAPALAAPAPALVAALAADGWAQAAAAIMTTDTRAKIRSIEVREGAQRFAVTGIAKGSGMIKPDMATMLAYVATDAAVTPAVWQAIARRATDVSFNRITVDGDTSTNDALVLMATGAADTSCVDSDEHPLFARLAAAVEAVCIGLAQDIIRDGEGATKFITVKVSGGYSERDCVRVAYAVAESPLVKTAMFASDANWGRILAAVGRAGAERLAIDEVNLSIGSLPIVIGGEPAPGYTEAAGSEIMKKPDIDIDITIGRGQETATVWTCDFSYDYVKINAEYRS
jgi:glutamate N-acetyltransferase/amino-acid N-acetyltransferase